MMMNILVIAMLGGIGYIWASRGFFSSLLHFGCVIVAGALAFALWETVAGLVLSNVETQWMVDLAWGASLLLPFVMMTAILTSAMNALVRANVQCDGVTNIVGGAVCGLGTAVITSGIVVLSLSNVRSKGDFLDYRAVAFDAQGSLVRNDGLWVPVDRLTAGLYTQMSVCSLASFEPLAKWRPQLALDGHLMRVGPDDSTLKFTLKAKDVGLIGRYLVGAGANAKVDFRELVGDSKKVLNFDGEDLSKLNNGQYHVEGYVLKFKAGAREKNGQVVVGPGHVQLVLKSFDDEEWMSVQPFCVVSQAKGDSDQFGRWRFDAKDVFIASPGASADPEMAFEFLVPKRSDGGWQPAALYVRGVRFDLEDPTALKALTFEEYSNGGSRDGAVATGDLVRGARQNVAQMDTGTATAFNAGGATAFDSPFQPTNRLQGFSLNKGDIRGIELNENGAIVGGRSRYGRQNLLSRGDDRSLMVEYIDPGPGSVIVQLNVSPESEFSLLDPAAEEAAGAPVLVDHLGQRYEAVGFVYEDASGVEVCYQPGSPITDKAQLPSLSRSRTDQKLRLIFRVSLNVSVNGYAIGTKLIKTINPPKKLDAPQKSK